jgi:hypothetical protein
MQTDIYTAQCGNYTLLHSSALQRNASRLSASNCYRFGGLWFEKESMPEDLWARYHGIGIRVLVLFFQKQIRMKARYGFLSLLLLLTTLQTSPAANASVRIEMTNSGNRHTEGYTRCDKQLKRAKPSSGQTGETKQTEGKTTAPKQ